MITVLTALFAAAPPAPVVCGTTPAVTEIHASWRALYDDWSGRDVSLAEAANDAEIRTALCGGTPCPTRQPAIATVWDGDQLTMSLVMPVAGKVHELRLPGGWREYQCSPDGDARISRKGDLLHLVATVTAPQARGSTPTVSRATRTPPSLASASAAAARAARSRGWSGSCTPGLEPRCASTRSRPAGRSKAPGSPPRAANRFGFARGALAE